ncbi:MAG: tyrosine-type recombinase/integrase [Akkermansiaceae bacterium]|nr:tyrosine-type recombinase/integrase [Akkermansiaceae bacterium]
MARKRKRRNSIVEIGTGPARVKIYTVNRKDGYPMFSLYWKEGGQRRAKHLACMEEARLIAQQISVRLENGFASGTEATKRNLELLRHCEKVASQFGVSLTAAMDEWASARKTAGDEIALSDAVRFYAANRSILTAVKTVEKVVDEFVESRRVSGVSDVYVRNCNLNLKRFNRHISGNIDEVTVTDINRFLSGLDGLGPVSRNAIRRNIVTMFRFAKKQGYLHPDRKTAAEQSESFKVPDKEIAIFTPEEMEKILMKANARILPLIAIGGFAGIRTAEIRRLHWEDIKWDRGYIEIAGRKAKTAARRLAPLSDNLKTWLAPWRMESGPIITMADPSGAMSDTAVKAQIPGGWRQNALRHSFISYRVAETGDVARTSLEAGNSPKQIFRHYREIVDEAAAKEWFSITPPEDWEPSELCWSIRERIRRNLLT